MDREEIAEQKAMELIKKVEDLFVAERASVPDALRALLILCAVNANNVHMSKETFLEVCGSVYENDNQVRNMDLN
jgi:hypothetical protein